MKIKTMFRQGLKASDGCTHGPPADWWRWWKPFAFSVVKLGVQPPNTGWRLWIYTRSSETPKLFSGDQLVHVNRGRCFDVYFDRRPAA